MHGGTSKSCSNWAWGKIVFSKWNEVNSAPYLNMRMYFLTLLRNAGIVVSPSIRVILNEKPI
jgi:hypothetical protein